MKHLKVETRIGSGVLEISSTDYIIQYNTNFYEITLRNHLDSGKYVNCAKKYSLPVFRTILVETKIEE